MRNYTGRMINDHLNNLLGSLTEYLSSEEYSVLERFNKSIHRWSIPSKTVLLHEGKIADTLYLITKGCLRLFFYNEGKDVTFQFFFEGDFVASFDSLYKRQPSLFSLESIEPTEVIAIRRDDVYACRGHGHCFAQCDRSKLRYRTMALQNRLFSKPIFNGPHTQTHSHFTQIFKINSPCIH